MHDFNVVLDRVDFAEIQARHSVELVTQGHGPNCYGPLDDARLCVQLVRLCTVHIDYRVSGCINVFGHPSITVRMDGTLCVIIGVF